MDLGPIIDDFNGSTEQMISNMISYYERRSWFATLCAIRMGEVPESLAQGGDAFAT